MRTWKLVSGILSCVLFMVVSFQSCAAGVVDAMEENEGTSGGSGMLVAILMLTGGIVSIASRKSYKNGGNIALIIMFGLAALVGYTGYGVFTDLLVWSTWCLINAILAGVAMVTNRRELAQWEQQNMYMQNQAWQGQTWQGQDPNMYAHQYQQNGQVPNGYVQNPNGQWPGNK